MLFLLAAVVACVSWTVTQEELFKEPREYCKRQTLHCRMWAQRKFFYLFTCEYCFSHYVGLAVAAAAGVRGFGLVAMWLALVWLANIYMSLYRLLRVVIKLIGIKVQVVEDARTYYQEQKEKAKYGIN